MNLGLKFVPMSGFSSVNFQNVFQNFMEVSYMKLLLLQDVFEIDSYIVTTEKIILFGIFLYFLSGK